MSTYLELCQAVRRECGVSGSGPSSVTGQAGMLQKIVEWVADADTEIQSLYTDWGFLWTQWTESTIAGTAQYAKPSDLGAWDRESFWLDYGTASHKKLVELKYKSWRGTLRQGVKTNQKPSYFVVLPSGNITLEAPPDAVYSLTADYWKTATRMTANASVSVIPAQFERTIIELAKFKYAVDEGAGALMASSQAAYLDWLGRLKAAELPERYRDLMAEAPDLTVIPE